MCYVSQLFLISASSHVRVSKNVIMPYEGFPGGSEGKASACDVGDPGSIPGSGRSPGEGNGNPLQYSCLEDPMGGGAWWAPQDHKESDTT